MENTKFDIAHKRKILYKRKRRRKFIFRVFLILTIFSLFTLISLLRKNIFSSAKVAFSNNDNKIIVCIDPGHGDWDTGAKGLSHSIEKDIVLDISLELGKLLEDNNIKVVYTRTNDSLTWLDNANDSLKERIKISEALKTDLFISIHCNSDYNDITTKGVETWYKLNNDNSKNLALTIQNSLTNLNYTENRNIKTYENEDDALAVLELNSSIPVLIELGFLSNSSDERYLISKKGQEYITNALKDSILTYIKENRNVILEEKTKK